MPSNSIPPSYALSLNTLRTLIALSDPKTRGGVDGRSAQPLIDRRLARWVKAGPWRRIELTERGRESAKNLRTLIALVSGAGVRDAR